MTTPSPEDRRVLEFLFEQGQLKRIPRSGWLRAGIDHPESVAEHNLRAAQLAYILAELEGHPDPARVCAMVVFHEIGETRVGDLDRIAKGYVQRAEHEAARDQLEALGSVGEGIYELWEEVEEHATPAGIIAKDADKLEAALTAKEYVESGHPTAQPWIDTTRGLLKTESAKRLIDELDDVSFTDWWQALP